MKILISLLFFLYVSSSALATSLSEPYTGSPYTGALGFEVFNLRFQNLHVWRRTQKLFWEVAKTTDWLLSIGFSGKTRFGENMTGRLAVPQETLGVNDEIKLSLESQYVPVDFEEAMGVCYNTSKEECFEKITYSGAVKETVFGDYFGSGAKYDTELQEKFKDSGLTRYDGSNVGDEETDTDIYKSCPFLPDSFLYKTNNEESEQNIEEMRQEVAGKLQSKTVGEDDTHIEKLPSTRKNETKKYTQESVALVFKNAMNFKQFDATQSIFRKLLNYSSGLRGAYQFSSHLALQQQNLLNKMIMNQYLGALKNWGVIVATQTASDNALVGSTTGGSTGGNVSVFDPATDRDFQNFIDNLRANKENIFWGELQ